MASTVDGTSSVPEGVNVAYIGNGVGWRDVGEFAALVLLAGEARRFGEARLEEREGTDGETCGLGDVEGDISLGDADSGGRRASDVGCGDEPNMPLEGVGEEGDGA